MLTTATARATARWLAAEVSAQRARERALAAAAAARSAARARAIAAYLERLTASGLHQDGARREVLAPEALPLAPRGALRVLWPGTGRPHLEGSVGRPPRPRPLALPGFARGIGYRVLSLDAATGAASLVLDVRAGFRQTGGYAHSALELYVTAGTLEVGEARHGAGGHLYVPPGVTLPPLAAPRGATVLAFYDDGPPSFVASDSDHPDADRDRLIAQDTTALDWTPDPARPADAAGVLVKCLREDPLTGASTRLVALPPDYRRDAVVFHDVAVETCQLRGTTTSLQFGDCAPGGYAWRPAYVNHGAVAARHGALVLVRSHGEFVNHFHANPWSTPEDNRRRALEALMLRRPGLFATRPAGRSGR